MSTLRVNTLQNTSTTDGGISINNSGHVTVDGVAMPSAGPLSNRNLIINGAMQVAQRGTSATNSNYGSVDRWRPSFNNVGITHSQQTLSSGDPYDEGFRYFYRQANTSVSSGASTYIEVFTKLESQTLAGSGWNYNSTSSYVTISFWARSSLAGTYYSLLRTADTNVKFYSKAFTLSADTWTKVTYTVPGHSDLRFDNDNGEGLRVHVIPYYGTNYTDDTVSTETWFTISGTNYMPDYDQNWANTASATFDITGVQLEVGEVATPFEHRSYGDELQRCLRYYQHYESNSTNNTYVCMGISAGSASARFAMALVAPMRAVPSVTASGAQADDQIANAYNLSSPGINAGTMSTLYLYFTTSGMTNGRPLHLMLNSSNYLAFSAEL